MTKKTVEDSRDSEATADYEVGYGKPPADTRFSPGRSGNPAGRPKKKKREVNIPEMNEERMKQLTLEEAYRVITVRDGEKMVEIPVMQAIIRSAALGAVKGDRRAQKMFTDLMRAIETERKDLYDLYLKTNIEYKLYWEETIEDCKARGLQVPKPVPHPDDIFINMQTGRVEIKGPMTPDEIPRWERLREHKAIIGDLIARLKKELQKNPDDKELIQALKRQEESWNQIVELVPDQPN